MSKPKTKSKKKSPRRAPKKRKCLGTTVCRGCHICRPIRAARKEEALRAQHADTGPGVWITRAGAIISLDRMSDSHLANSIAMLARKLAVLTTEAARRARDAVTTDVINEVELEPSDWKRG
jgi:hypothetical protein